NERRRISKNDDGARRPAGGRAAALAPGLSHRCGAGRVRGPARFHQIHGPHQPRLRRRTALDRGGEFFAPGKSPAGGARDCPPRRDPRRRFAGVRLPRAASARRARAPRRVARDRLQPEVHPPLLSGDSAARRKPLLLSLSPRKLRSRARAAARRTAAPPLGSHSPGGSRPAHFRHRNGAPDPMTGPRFALHQRKTIVSGILTLVLILAILQLWLLSATMNAYLAGD